MVIDIYIEKLKYGNFVFFLKCILIINLKENMF